MTTHDHKPSRFFFAALLIILVILSCSLTTLGGGGPQNVLVVVNDEHIESQQLGQYYQEQRGIPERNICHLSFNPNLEDVAWNQFETGVVNMVKSFISDNGLTNQIDYIVLCSHIPSRIKSNESATAVMFYGFKNAPSYFAVGCNMPSYTESFYYKAEKAFHHADTYGSTNYYLAMMLTGKTLAQAKTNVDVGIAADGAAWSGTFYLHEDFADVARNIRYKLFDNMDFHARFHDDFPTIKYQSCYPHADILGFVGGNYYYVPIFWSNIAHRAGAMSDHFTSYGGRLGDHKGHSSVLDWIEAGAVASHGIVNEPCAYLEKFPNPLNHYWSYRGFNVAESYYMSINNPYQGLLVGEPLAAPYAYAPSVVITNLFTNDVVSGVVTVEVFATTNVQGTISRAVDLYVDEVYVTNLVTADPAAGNMLEAVIGGVTCSYSVTSAETLYDAVDGLAYNINTSTVPVIAYDYGDRIMLVYTNYGQPGAGIEYSANTYTGAAAELTVWGETLTTNLLETAYHAREYAKIKGGPANTGDTASCEITLTNGVVVTNIVYAMANESAAGVMNRLWQMVNSNATLQATNGVYANRHYSYPTSKISFDARKPGPEGYNLQVHFQVTRKLPAVPYAGLSATNWTDNFNENKGDLTARGTLLFQAGRNPLTVSYPWDTTAFDDGPHDLRVVTRLGTATEVQGHYVLPVVVSNSSLTCTITSPTNGQEFFFDTNVTITVQATATNEAASVTQVVFYVEGKETTTDAGAPYSSTWDTLDYGVGTVSVKARAFDSVGNIAVSAPVTVQVPMSATLDTDGDGLGDKWEQDHFGTIELYVGEDDPDNDGMPNSWEEDHGLDPSDGADGSTDADGDGALNYEEYVADTNPNVDTNFFWLDIAENTNEEMEISFGSSTARQYKNLFQDDWHTNFAAWSTASPSFFWGTGSKYLWVDDGSETGTHPSNTDERIYKMHVIVP